MSSSMFDQRRDELFDAAARYEGSPKTVEDQRALCDAASAYHKEREAHFKPKQNAEAAGLMIPFGRSKGTPIGEASKADLEWVLPKMREKLDDPAKQRYRAQDEKLIAAIERELGTR